MFIGVIEVPTMDINLHRQLVHTRKVPAHMEYWIWLGTYFNGSQTGPQPVIIQYLLRVILLGHCRGTPRLCAEVPGVLLLMTICALLIAMLRARIGGMIIMVFVAPAQQTKEERIMTTFLLFTFNGFR
jgi:hypothetical protein